MTCINPPPRASFNSLPLEIRQEIWSLTLVPRILCLLVYRRCTPPFGSNKNGGQLGTSYRKTCVSCICTILPLASTPEEVFVQFAESLPPRVEDDSQGTMGQMAFKLPDLGLAALYVCRESRELAIQKGYELAFGGEDLYLSHRSEDQKSGTPKWEKRRVEMQDEDQATWTKGKLWKKSIWVNFATDVVFLDGNVRAGLFSRCAHVMPVRLLSQYAPEVAGKIRKLPLGGSGTYGVNGMVWLYIGEP